MNEKKYTNMNDADGNKIFEGQRVRMTVPESHYTIVGNGYLDVGTHKGFVYEGEVKLFEDGWHYIVGDDDKRLPLDFENNQILEVIEEA